VNFDILFRILVESQASFSILFLDDMFVLSFLSTNMICCYSSTSLESLDENVVFTYSLLPQDTLLIVPKLRLSALPLTLTCVMVTDLFLVLPIYETKN